MPITVTKLKEQLKQGNMQKIYLLCGEEKFLRNLYFKQIKDAVLSGGMAEFNYDLFDGDSAEFDSFTDAIERYPQMADKKIVVARNTPFLKTADCQKKMLALLNDLPDFCVTVFVEDDTAKIKKDIVAAIEKNGAVVDFEKQQPSDLRSYINRRFADSGKKMKIVDMEHLVEVCGRSLESIDTECGKLIAHAGDADVISRSDIEKLVTPPTEYKIFEMSDKLLTKDADGAYALLREFKNNKEQPTVIISIIYSQLSLLYMFKRLIPERVNAAEFLPPNRRFLARKLEQNQKKYSERLLRDVMECCAHSDIAIKTGKLEGYTALEIIMAKMLKGEQKK